MGRGLVEGTRGRPAEVRADRNPRRRTRRPHRLAWLIGAFTAAIAFALTGAATAGAATVLSQDFESGLQGWSTSGFWHIQTNPQTIAVNSLINPRLVTLPDSGALPAAYQGSSVAWFGETATGTYCGAASINSTNDRNQIAKNGCTSYDASGALTSESGDLISPSFSLAGVTSPLLQFESWWEIEGVNPSSVDTMEVDYSLDGGATWNSLGKLNPATDPPATTPACTTTLAANSCYGYTDNGFGATATWHPYAFDLSPLAGKPSVMLRFHFDTVDSNYNGFRGWLLDNISVSGSAAQSSPAVTPGAPRVLSSTSAAFTGTVNPDGVSTTAYFQYGLDPSYTGGGPVTYPNQVVAQPNPVGADFNPHAVNATVPGPGASTPLVPNALYHVRLVAVNSAGTTFGPDQTFRTSKDPAPTAPALGQVNASPVSGTPLVRFSGGSGALSAHATTPGPGFIPLTEARKLPAGTQFDTRSGTVKLTNATGKKKGKKLQNATVNGAIFSFSQSRSGKNKGLTTLKVLEGAFPGAPSFASCNAKKAEAGPQLGEAASALAQVAVSRSVLSTLRVRSKGSYSSRGRYGSATARATAWTIKDRCDGTLISVQKDVVVVRDFVLHKTITLHAGQHYLIKAKRK